MAEEFDINCAKGLDRSFLHYGIREDDLKIIRELCVKYAIPEEWLVDEGLKKYHEARVRDIELRNETIERVVESALEKVTEVTK